MTALASSDVTVTIIDRFIQGKRRRVSFSLAFGDAALTYPSGGVPLPTYPSFGMKRNLAFLLFDDPNSAQGIVWKYDRANHKLRAYIQGVVVSAAGAATMDDFPQNTTAEPLGTAVSLSLTNSTGAGTKYLGRLQELTTTQAPAASTLYGEAVGW